MLKNNNVYDIVNLGFRSAPVQLNFFRCALAKEVFVARSQRNRSYSQV